MVSHVSLLSFLFLLASRNVDALVARNVTSSEASTTATLFTDGIPPAVPTFGISDTLFITPSVTTSTADASVSSTTSSAEDASTSTAALVTSSTTQAEGGGHIPVPVTGESDTSFNTPTTSAIVATTTNPIVPTTSSTVVIHSSPAVESSATELSTPPSASAPSTTTSALTTPVIPVPASTASGADTPSTSVASTVNAVTSSSSGIGAVIASILGGKGTATSSSTATDTAPVPVSVSSAASSPFTYAPSTSDSDVDSTTTPAVVSLGSSTITIAPVVVPTSDATISAATDATAPSAYIIGSQTASVGGTITIDSTPVVVQTSAGNTAVVIGSSTAVVLSTPAATEADSAPTAYLVSSQTLALSAPITIGSGSSTAVVSLLTDAAGVTEVVAGSTTVPLANYLSSNPSVSALTPTAVSPTSSAGPVTVAGLTLSQNSASAILLGSLTLTPGETITQGRGVSATIIAVNLSSGTPQLLVQDASTTASGVLPTAYAQSSDSTTTSVATAAAASSSTPSADVTVVGGKSVTLSAATLSAGSSSSASHFVTLPAATSTSNPALPTFTGSTAAAPTAWSQSRGLTVACGLSGVLLAWAGL